MRRTHAVCLDWDILFDGNLQAMRKDVVTRLADDVLIQLLSSLLVGFMVSQPLLRLRHPRPEPRQLIRQSGFVACTVSMGAALAAFAIVGMGWFSESVLSLRVMRGLALMLFWIVVGIPPWQSEASWIDRLGRAVGWGWIIAIAAQAVLNPRRIL